MESSAVRRKMDEDEAKLKRGADASANSSSLAVSDLEAGNETFVRDTRMQVKQNIDKQDEALAKLGVAVDSLGKKFFEILILTTINAFES